MPDQPTVPGRQRAAATNFLLDRVLQLNWSRTILHIDSFVSNSSWVEWLPAKVETPYVVRHRMLSLKNWRIKNSTWKLMFTNYPFGIRLYENAQNKYVLALKVKNTVIKRLTGMISSFPLFENSDPCATLYLMGKLSIIF